MPQLIPDDGPKSAKLVVVAEMDATHEEAQRRHLVGPSGAKWMGWLREVGLQRSDCYVTNVVPFRANKANKIALVPRDELAYWIDQLHGRLAALHDPVLIVPMGNVALQALTGHSYISKRRGSIYQYVDRQGRAIKVIGTLHPAAVFNQPKWEKRCILDWHRIASDLDFRDLRLPDREHFIKPTLADLNDYLADAATRAEVLAYDIETPRELTLVQTKLKSGKPGKPKRVLGDPRITCVGFAFESHFSMTIPLTLSYWRDEGSLAAAWTIVKRLLALACEKGGQNAYTFDNPWLADYGIGVENFRWDSLSLHHAFDSLDEHTLHYMASIDSREPYWKDECLKGEVEVLTPSGWRRLDEIGDEVTALQWSPNGNLNWTLAKRTILPATKRELLHFKLRGHDCSYTEQHRIPVMQPRVRFQVDLASDAARRMSFQLPVAGCKSAGVTEPDFLRLVAAIQADAKLLPNTARFTLKKGKKIERLRLLCGRLGVRLDLMNAPEGYTILVARGEAVSKAASLLGTRNDKRFGAWLLGYDAQSLGALAEEVQFWDGHTHQRNASWSYFSKEKTNVNWIATAAALSGHATNVMSMKSCWRVTIKPRPHVIVQGPKHATREAFGGFVYCLSTESSFFLARSNDQIFVTGNSKDPDEISRFTSNIDQFHTYNGKDVAVTWELIDTYVARHAAKGTLPFYQAMYADLYQPLLDLMRRGIAINDQKRRLRYARLLANCFTIQKRLSEIAGETLYGAKSLSSKKLANFLYQTLKLPLQRNRKTGAPTTKEVTIRRLTLQFPQKLGRLDADLYARPLDTVDGAGPLILRHRRDDILSKFYSDARVDPDIRIRCTYKISTATWRLASSKNWRRTGANLQNQDREARDAFVPDPGCIFEELDLSQAEDRVVRMLTRSPRQIAIARSQPWELDVHRRSAKAIFHIDEERVSKDQRYLGKRANHAGNYGMRGMRLSEELLKDGYVRDPDECDRMIDAILTEDHEKLDWQREVRQKILRDRCLTNSWGCVIDFTYERLNDDLYRVGYAFEPQSEVGILLNRWGFVPVSNFLRERPDLGAAINIQGHDSLLISTPPEHAWEVYQFARASLERPRRYRGQDLTIPVEVKLGTTWSCEVEYKRPPSREEFEAKAFELYDAIK